MSSWGPVALVVWARGSKPGPFAALERTLEKRWATRPGWLGRVRERLDCPGDPPEVRELARDAAVHPRHLMRAFRQYHGCSVGGYLRRLGSGGRGACLPKRPWRSLPSRRMPGSDDQSHFAAAAPRSLVRAIGAADLSGLLLANGGAHLGASLRRGGHRAQAVRLWPAGSRRSACALPRGLSPCASPASRRIARRADSDSEQLPLLLRHCGTQEIPGITRLKRSRRSKASP